MSSNDDNPFLYGYAPVAGNESRITGNKGKRKEKGKQPARDPPEKDTDDAKKLHSLLYKDKLTTVYVLIFKPPRGHWYQWSLGMVNGNTGQWKLFEAVQDQADDPDPTERQTWNYWEDDPRGWDGFVTMYHLTQTRVANLSDMQRMALMLQDVARPDLNSQGYVIEFGHRLREAGLCTAHELEEIWQLLHEYHGRKDDEIGFERAKEQREELEHLQPVGGQTSDDDMFDEDEELETLEDFEQLQYGVRDFEQSQEDVQEVIEVAGPSWRRGPWERPQLEEPEGKRAKEA
ncbi:hypothetical protein QQX98_006228 [Neonectria punicea]|uniref:Uncharacterized protein n=1 Tax=Neonectria punicea TaxID=979145 RepID=A0ABR1H1N6_9HYPO